MFNTLKKSVAKFALKYVPKNAIIGIGSGSTINYFIKELSKISSSIRGVVPGSIRSEKKLRKHNIPIIDLNSLEHLDIYIDSADKVNTSMEMIKGAGGALTREKIISSVAKKFICIIDKSKYVRHFDCYSFPLEVIPMALRKISEEIIKLGGMPKYRENFITDNGHCIIDIHNLYIKNSIDLEKTLNNLPGIVSVGLFCIRKADLLLVSYADQIKEIY
ncbi:Ribose-5-phosphate isomerase A [Buchnera aphidicola (Cinara piceae)]|uniref:Ribose-5-phosphate isomerase A n=1 Tax=Buchnera aphidicola (Cinara piceae) TaxID=1660043 RepID=A0A803FU37_9GAMM|nr:ribose-5-phosphate isomerase RpiA [Buchnera aphidicola]VFP88524.1 Ribose-5-phosphate isomerase A [Buchnera aphidicola (Cinara piceae)]